MSDLDIILTRLNEIDTKVSGLSKMSAVAPPEIIDTKTLCERLFISEPTAIRYRKKKKIPSFTIGSSVRYNWVSVVAELENSKK